MTFDTETFRKGHAQVCSEEAMDEHDIAFQNQALWNFDSARAKLRNSQRKLGRDTRSVVADFDTKLNESVVDSLNYKQLSRYVLEDVLTS